MNKKADFTTEEILKLILAVLGIVLLFYLAFNLYGIFRQKTEFEQAKSTLDEIFDKANFLKEAGDYTDVLVIAPKDWRILYYSDGEELCICPRGVNEKDQKDKCDQQGICESSEPAVKISDVRTCRIVSTFRPAVDISPCLSLEELPKEIFLKNVGEFIEILYPIEVQSVVFSEVILEELETNSNFQSSLVKLLYETDKLAQEKLIGDIKIIVENIITEEDIAWEVIIRGDLDPKTNLLKTANISSEIDGGYVSLAGLKSFEFESKEYEFSLLIGEKGNN